MKLIFLDIDGVLVTDRTLRAFTKKLGNPFDPYCVTQLNKLIEKTEAKLVVSSTWRMGRTLKEMQNVLTLNGVIGKCIGMTPVLHVHRGLEIQKWLDEHTDALWQEICILDDDSDMDHLEKFLVQTNMYGGLRIKHRIKAEKMLIHGVM